MLGPKSVGFGYAPQGSYLRGTYKEVVERRGDCSSLGYWGKSHQEFAFIYDPLDCYLEL